MSEPRRVEGPTPAGGAYAIAYSNAAGEIVEIVEFDEQDRPIARTYTAAFERDEGDPPST